MLARPRSADPYRDLDVIDARAPRFNQTVIGLGSLIAIVTGWWPILALLAIQLGVGLRFGRRYCLPCVAYFTFVQPRVGEGPIEDSRPPRFANQVGFVVLGAASISYVAGLTLLGVALGGLVATLALLAAMTGFCLGCEIYKVSAKVLGIRSRRLDRIDLRDLGVTDRPTGELVVSFGHPLCTDCQAFETEVRTAGRRLVSVDVRSNRSLARKYGIALVPTAVAVAPDGRVTARLAG
ncbi:MAG TPA: DUF4395 family protein [Candidatus Limnocylindrales bacterium]|nr:DUF4395 family protein [Candidatus Limnocylindrales bacterium]